MLLKVHAVEFKPKVELSLVSLLELSHYFKNETGTTFYTAPITVSSIFGP